MRKKTHTTFKKLLSFFKLKGLSLSSIEKDRLNKFSTLDFLKMTYKLAALTVISFWRKHRIASRLLALFLLLVLLFSIWQEVHDPISQELAYDLSGSVSKLLDEPRSIYANKLQPDPKTEQLLYNPDYRPGGDVAGESFAPKFSASFEQKPRGAAIVKDAVNDVQLTFTPEFSTRTPRKDQNRVVYPINGLPAVKVYTLKASGMKEDIILREKPSADKLEFAYKLDVSDGLEIRVENDGSVGVYGVSSALLGNVSTATEDDAELLNKARQNAPKNNLIFAIPAPYILENDRKTLAKEARAWFELRDDILTLHAEGLHSANYPLSIDPTIYIETARKLMRGNNETNTDFDTDNELIQKSQTTGARIDDWTNTNNLDEAVWKQATAAAGGFIYTVGGEGGDSTTTVTYYSAGSDSFVVPAGVTSITAKTWGGGGGGGGGTNGSGVGGNGGGGGYAKAVLSTTPGETLTITVGSGGAKAALNGRAGNGGGYSSIDRSSTMLLQAGGGGGGAGRRGSSGGTIGHGGAGGGVTGVNGSGNSSQGGQGGTASAGGANGTGTGSGVSGVANAGGNGGTTAACATAATGTGGAGGTGGGGSGGTFTTTCAPGGGGGGGRFGGGGGASFSTNNRTGGGGGGGSSLATGTDIVQTAGSGTTPGNSADADRNGSGAGGSGATTAAGASDGASGAVVITYVIAGSAETDTVSWAEFNDASAIVSPNPGTGACSGWCNEADYDLPETRVGHSMVAYNGYLYVVGGYSTSCTGALNACDTTFIAKLGANGEPQLWSPDSDDPNDWTYWYESANLLPAATRFGSMVAYNNRLYYLGGQTNAASTGVTSVVVAQLNPTGDIENWSTTGTVALPAGAGRFMHSVQVYNGVLYTIGGFEGAATSSANMRNTVYYSKLNDNGSMNAWQQTNSFSGARASLGGSYSTIYGAYLYLGGGCTAVNGSGHCTTISNDVQLASINADGSIAPWNAILGLENQRIGHTLLSWQGGLYRLGGCRAQNTTTGVCTNTTFDVDYGVINNDGDASTVSNSEPSGTSPCNGANPTNCDLPPAGDGAGQGGQMSSMAVINNGYIYNIGGCVAPATSCNSNMSGNISYAALNAEGQMVAPAVCPHTSYGLWCVDSTNQINGTAGLGAAGSTVFNNTIYVTGGVNGSSTWQANIWRVGLNVDGSLAGAWTTQTFASVGLTGTADDARGYMYTFARANPSSAGTNPGNLFMLGGCQATSGIGCSTYYTDVIKCNIQTSGAVAGCTTTGQLQIDADNIAAGNQGLGLMAGTIYANRIYLVGGSCSATGAAENPCGSDFAANRKDTIYARIDNSNNIVAESGGVWQFATAQMDPVRRRAVSFGYNGYIYSLAGFSGAASLQDLLFSKIDVSTGDMGPWDSSGVVVTPRWDLRAVVNNGYVYAIGGCASGAAPNGCSAMQAEVQTFQLYNNDSGSPIGYSASASQFATDRIGASSAIRQGRIYLAGGCTGSSDCATLTTNVQYATLDTYGTISSWTTATNVLPAARAWGELENAGDTLYYIGGQDSGGTAQTTVYRTQTFSGAGNINSAWTTTTALPSARTQHSATVWDNRIYVTGGVGTGGTCTGGVCDTVFISPRLSSGGAISSWTTSTSTFNVDRSGHTAIAYANNLYILGGYDGTNYLNDVQFASLGYKTGTIAQSGTTVTGTGTSWSSDQVGAVVQYRDGSTATVVSVASGTSMQVSVSKTVSSGTGYTILDGSVGSWSYSTSLPETIRQADGFAANGYMYLVGGRTGDTSCSSNTWVAPISANTTIASGNDPTGVGEWYETNAKYTGARYGSAVSYLNGKIYAMGGACSGFPTFSSFSTQTFAASTTHNVTMPATVDSGDLLLVLLTNDDVDTIVDPDGAGPWTQISNQVGTGVQGSVWAKVADGTEDGTNVNFATATSETAAAHVYRVSAGDWSGTIAGVEAAPVNSGNVNNPNPPALNPAGWGTENTMWIAFAGGSSYNSTTAYPANYTSGVYTASGTTVDDASVSSAWRQNAVASEDPAAFTMGNTTNSIAFTIAIRPAGFAYTGANRTVQTAVYSQPQVARYSRLIDTDTDVFPNSWLLNGIDNSIGARWRARYQTATDGFTGGSSIVFDEDFEDGANGANFDDNLPGTTVDYRQCYNNGSANYPSFTNGWAIGGTLSGRYRIPSGSGNTGCYNFYTLTSTRYERFYIRFDGTPSSNTVFYNVNNNTSGHTVAQLRITNGGLLQMRDEFTQKGSQPSLDTTSAGNRIEVGLFNDTMTVRLYRGANIHGIIPDFQQTITLVNSPADTFDTIGVGIIQTVNGDYSIWMDDHKTAADNWVGSANPPDVSWGQSTSQGDISLGDVMVYNPIDVNGDPVDFARWYYFFIEIDASQTFGYPEDVNRGPTISDLSLFFTADPNRRLRHGKTFTGGEQQPLDTPCRQNIDADCPLPAP